MASKEILIVDDEKEIASILVDYLKRDGFGTSTKHEGTGVVESVRKKMPDLILLDLNLPGEDGVSICRAIRTFSNVPIIMITARVDEIDRLVGLELGADDYICKPFSPREVVARVKTVLRRQGNNITQVERIVLGELVVDPGARTLTVSSQHVETTPYEFELIRALTSRPNFVFPRHSLLFEINGMDAAGYDRTVDSHIKNLRKKIGVHLPDVELISTVYGVGYKLNHPV